MPLLVFAISRAILKRPKECVCFTRAGWKILPFFVSSERVSISKPLTIVSKTFTSGSWSIKLDLPDKKFLPSSVSISSFMSSMPHCTLTRPL